MVTVSWIVIVLGIFATMFGIAGAIVQLIKSLESKTGRSYSICPQISWPPRNR